MKPPVFSFDSGSLRDAQETAQVWPQLALLGDPVAHSLSPQLHEAALQALRIEGSYRAVHVGALQLAPALRSAWDGGVLGLQLTLPHKQAVLRHCSTQSAAVRKLQAANTLRRGDAGWEAHNTDLPGLVVALRESFPHAPWKGRCAILGAGGAARACLAALEELDSGPRLVLARHPDRALWVLEQDAALAELGACDLDDRSLVLQATPLGLHPEDPSPIDPASLPEGCSVMDLCYGDRAPRLLREHATRGPVADGRAMLVAQAEIALQLWFPGCQPREALRQALSH